MGGTEEAPTSSVYISPREITPIILAYPRPTMPADGDVDRRRGRNVEIPRERESFDDAVVRSLVSFKLFGTMSLLRRVEKPKALESESESESESERMRWNGVERGGKSTI
jgi:hypothetical protein